MLIFYSAYYRALLIGFWLGFWVISGFYDDKHKEVIMDLKKQAGSLTIVVLVLLMGLQGCSREVMKRGAAAASHSKPSRPVKSVRSVKIPQLGDADTVKLFQKGRYVNLIDVGRGYKKGFVNEKMVNQPLDMPVISSPVLRQAILSTSRGKALSACRFRAVRVEVDGRKSTADWLVTTRGKGGRCAGDTQFFWVIQQGSDAASPAQILLQGRASWVSVRKAKDHALSEVSVGNSGHIKVSNGDKLSDGSYVQVDASDHGRVEVSCRSKFRLQGKQYKLDTESVEAYVSSAMSSGKSWQSVDDPRYRCPF